MKAERVRVYVWVSHIQSGSPGHAAIQIECGTTPATGYVSFAPEVQRSISGPGKFYDKSHDDEHYSSRGVWIGTIWGLDTENMRKQLRKEYEGGMHYHVLNSQCATMVKRILSIGGGDKLASWWSRNNVGPISPDDVEDFARSIVEKTKPNGSYSEKINGLGTTMFSKESQPKLRSRN